MDTQLRSQTKTETETPARPFAMLYCIKCGRMEKVEYGTDCRMGHTITASGEIDYCCFEDGYALMPPPEVSWLPEEPGDLAEQIVQETEEVEMWLGGGE